MPVNKISTPDQKKSLTLPQYAEKISPKESTIAVLRLFARTYNPAENGLNKSACN